MGDFSFTTPKTFDNRSIICYNIHDILFFLGGYLCEK